MFRFHNCWFYRWRWPWRPCCLRKAETHCSFLVRPGSTLLASVPLSSYMTLSKALSLSELPWEITSSLYPPYRGLWRRRWRAACEALAVPGTEDGLKTHERPWSVSSTAAVLPGRAQWTRLQLLVRGRGGACISFPEFSPRALST